MIGVFDSGFGGLTVVRALRTHLPHADILYFGDSRNAPYGEKSNDALRSLGQNAASLLARRGATSLLSACGTLSAVALDRIEVGLPLSGVLLPAAGQVRGRRVAVLATPAAIRSHAYLGALRAPGREVYELACPTLVPLVERGADARTLAHAVAAATQPLRAFSPDTILLGCTHYPFLAEAVASCFPTSALLSASAAGAEDFARRHPEENEGHGTITLLTSGDPAAFRRGAAALCGIDLPAECIKIE